MAVYFSPVANEQVVDTAGAPLVGGYWEVYLAGTTTPVTTYTSNTGLTAQAAQIVLDASGRTANPIWLTGGVAVKFRLSSAAAVVLLTIDNVSGVNDPAGITSQDQWVLYAAAPTYISATSFSVVGDQTGTFQVGRRVKTTNSGGTRYSSITASVFGAVTTVTVVNDSGVLDAGLSAVSYGLLSATNPSVPTTYAKSGANTDITSLASATTVTTQAAADASTKIASTAYVDRVSSKLPGITAAVAANALTITVNAQVLDFRSATLGSGTVNTRTIATPITVVISSGSTLGTTNAVASKLAVLAIDNAGTVEVAVVNSAGTYPLDESALITTTAEGGAGAADSISVPYSTTARASVPFRILGYVVSTQATAGTWATAPSTIQGKGGEVSQSFTAKAWAFFNGTTVGTNVPTAGYNVTNVTRNGAGDYTVNFTNPMTNASYAVVATGASNAGTRNLNDNDTTTARTVSAVRLISLNSGNAATDSDRVSVMVFGV